MPAVPYTSGFLFRIAVFFLLIFLVGTTRSEKLEKTHDPTDLINLANSLEAQISALRLLHNNTMHRAVSFAHNVTLITQSNKADLQCLISNLIHLDKQIKTQIIKIAFIFQTLDNSLWDVRHKIQSFTETIARESLLLGTKHTCPSISTSPCVLKYANSSPTQGYQNMFKHIQPFLYDTAQVWPPSNLMSP